MKKPFLYNIVPVIGDNTDFAISEILRQHEEVGLTKFLVMLSCHPQTTPARDLISSHCRKFAAVRDGVAGKGIELGVLIQSLQGMGWNGKIHLTGERWQHTVKSDGNETPRMCILDPDFRAYGLECIRAIVSEGAEFLLIDDDFAVWDGECFCPYHLKKLNEALNTSYSQADFNELLKEKPISDPFRQRVFKVLLGLAVDYAKEIRGVIDSINPKLRCGYCVQYGSDQEADAIVHAFAGNTEPVLRVHDDMYGDPPTDCFPISFIMANRVKHLVNGVNDLLDESDTFPHNYMSVSAATFHSHITMALLSGFTGCKLWTSEYEKAVHTGSQARYEKKLRDYKGYYEAICDLAPQISWKGISAPAFTGAIPSGSYYGNWDAPIECVYGLPFRCEKLDAKGITALRGCDAELMTDEQLCTLLAHDVVVDSLAARIISERGLACHMGISADTGDKDFFFSVERTADDKISSGYLWDDSTSRLTVIDDKTKVLSWFCKGAERAFPAATLFRNSLGGNILVLGWSLELVYHKMYRPARREILLSLLDSLAASPFEMVLENGEKSLVRHGLLPDKREILSVTPLGFDVLDELPLRLFRTPVAIEKMLPDGTWAKAEFHRENGSLLNVSVPVVCYEPILLRFTF